MEEVLALIEKIIAEHKLIRQRAENLEKAANDAEAIASMEKAKEVFQPGRFEQKEGLLKMKDLLAITDKGLEGHFNREETTLLAAFEQYGDKEFTSRLRSLLLEHADLRNRFAVSKKRVDELIGGGLSRHVWDASAHDMRAHMSHTRKLLEVHAQIEEELLNDFRRILLANKKD